jgi:hypothetical protein
MGGVNHSECFIAYFMENDFFNLDDIFSDEEILVAGEFNMSK